MRCVLRWHGRGSDGVIGRIGIISVLWRGDAGRSASPPWHRVAVGGNGLGCHCDDGGNDGLLIVRRPGDQQTVSLRSHATEVSLGNRHSVAKARIGYGWMGAVQSI